MPRVGNTWVPPAGSWNPAVGSTTISSTDWDALLADMVAVVSDSVSFAAAQAQAYTWGGIAGGTANALTISLTPAITAYTNGLNIALYTGAAANSGAATLAVNGLTAIAIQLNGSALVAGQLAANTLYRFTYYNSVFHMFPAPALTPNVPVRQTVLSGPVDSNGFSAFGGSTGSGTVTTTGTLIPTVANGFTINGDTNLIGSIVNASWTGLTTNGTMYLYLDIAASGTCTTGAGTLAPIYQWGGTYSTTNNQFTFNIQEMVGKVGNGASATQTNRVYVGEVTVAGSVVTVITWYQLQGRYISAFTNTLPGTGVVTTFSHNIGTNDVKSYIEFEIINSTNNGYAVGERIVSFFANDGTSPQPYALAHTTLTAVWPAGNNATPWGSIPRGGGARANFTLANAKFRCVSNRDW